MASFGQGAGTEIKEAFASPELTAPVTQPSHTTDQAFQRLIAARSAPPPPPAPKVIAKSVRGKLMLLMNDTHLGADYIELYRAVWGDIQKGARGMRSYKYRDQLVYVEIVGF